MSLRSLVLGVALLFCYANPVAMAAPAPPADAVLPAIDGLADDCQLRSGLDNCRSQFTRNKTGVVVYVGGSITASQGWSQLIDDDLARRFPETKFTFVHAGIPSIDSTGHAFRAQRDVLEKGIPDLVFVEAAVNDLHNGRDAVERRRAMEGIVRKVLKVNRFVDIVFLHFAEPRHTADYARGQTPAIITSHEEVAERYQIPSLNLAHEVQRRIAAEQFDWARDFVDLHPSPFGHRLYYQAVRRMFDQAWAKPLAADAALRERTIGKPLDPFCYDAGLLASPNQAEVLRGFKLVEKWRPADKASTRDGFVGVPMFVGEHAGDSFSYRFDGRGVGMFLTAGPDTGVVEYRIDGGAWKRRDTLTRWSRSLHLPWVLMLETELKSGPHTLELRLAEPTADRGTALRIRDLVVNGPVFDLPPLAEIQVKSTLDGTLQPSLLWAPEAGKPGAAAQPRPLLVYLHSWSSDYRQDNSPWYAEAVARGWIFLHPNFRGVNKQPEACGSQLARQDILDAIDHVAKLHSIDRERIYLAGVSGGGHMALLMAGYFPDRFSAVSAWVGISDLAEWQRFHVKDGQPDHYAQMAAACLGGAPGESPERDAEYRARSPLFHLARVGDLPIDIAAGVKDGKTGSVPIQHSLGAFNAIAKANGHAEISAAEIKQLWEQGVLAQPTPSDQETDATFARRLLLRRSAGPARVTIFDGGHEGLPRAGSEWLAKQHRKTTDKP